MTPVPLHSRNRLSGLVNLPGLFEPQVSAEIDAQMHVAVAKLRAIDFRTAALHVLRPENGLLVGYPSLLPKEKE